ncbi:hypothetical protein BV22DRAFT_1017667 [Leucogyrophana mollusca]|uniref:Uncharacterized protein n=1 Tax=Leucogyrophana mollusca TaxID=85980 RepID=A0ACB8BAJ8_9AGAM|nr:hypothetical protein BV22DRAFT_1017667 [Leucogyrophana mollusca]
MYFNTSVANFSPLLLYIPQALWWEAPPNDPSLVNYATKSYHATNASQGRGSISFYWSGTGIWKVVIALTLRCRLYGGYQPTLGAYQIILDGQVYNYSGIRDNSSSLAGYLLHGSQGLAAGSHSIEMINVSQDPDQDILDLDYVWMYSPFSLLPFLICSYSLCLKATSRIT